MSIIIGDIHGDVTMAKAFLSYRPQAEHIALGDYIDSRAAAATAADELACLNLLIESDTTLLWGNHELAYLPQPPWTLPPRFAQISDQIQQRLDAAAGRFKAAHAADGWLCTHAGVSSYLTAELPGCPWDGCDLERDRQLDQ